MAQATEADDADLLAGTAAPGLEGRVDGDTAAEERSGELGLQALRDLDDEARLGAVVRGVAAVGLVAVLVDAAVRVDVLGAVGLVVAVAGNALGARVGLGADADEVANLDVALGVGTNADGLADNLVADDAGVSSRALEVVMSC